MIKIFVRFLKEILKISEEKIKPRIQIHNNVSDKKAVSYWSKILHVPKNKFYVGYQVSRASQGKRPKNSLPYGTCEIRVNNQTRFFEIMGLIDGIIKRTI